MQGTNGRSLDVFFLKGTMLAAATQLLLTPGGAEDRRIVCRDCGIEFRWTAGERRFFEERGLQAPKSCGDCRAARKALGLRAGRISASRAVLR